MIVHNSRLSIVDWLNLLELQQYEGQFDQQFVALIHVAHPLKQPTCKCMPLSTILEILPMEI